MRASCRKNIRTIDGGHIKAKPLLYLPQRHMDIEILFESVEFE